jgi:hypothetical protein
MPLLWQLDRPPTRSAEGLSPDQQAASLVHKCQSDFKRCTP